jgi:hypothetical protein
MQKSVHEIRDYIFKLINFVVNNQEHFQTNSAINGVNTRNRNHLHGQIANPSCFQKSAYYAGIKIFNTLPSNLRSLYVQKGTIQSSIKEILKYSLLLLC